MTDNELILRSRLEETERRLMEAHAEIERLNEINARRAEAAEARVKELESRLESERITRDHVIEKGAKLESRLFAVTEAADDVCSEYELVLKSVESNSRRFPRSHVMLAKFYAARSADQPSTEDLSAVSPTVHPSEGEPVEPCPYCLGSGIAGDLPPHPDTERMDWLLSKSTNHAGAFMDLEHPWGPAGRPMEDFAKHDFGYWLLSRAAIDAARAQEGGAE